MYIIELTNHSKKFLKKCDSSLYQRIREKIKKLQEEPFPQSCKMVEGRKEKTFRVRVGDYRILYSVFTENNTIIIQDIDKRLHVYD